MSEQVCPDCGSQTPDGHTADCRWSKPFTPDYDWTSTCPHDETISDCPEECQCECHAIREDVRP